MNNLSKYQETAKRIIEILKVDNFELNMGSYNSADAGLVLGHSCGTSFCLAGWLAYKDGYPEEYAYCETWFDHGAYSEDLIGNTESHVQDKWRFLFGTQWSDVKSLAIKRAEYVLEHDNYPHKSTWPAYGYSGLVL